MTFMKLRIFILRVLRKLGLLSRLNLVLCADFGRRGGKIRLPIIEGFGIQNLIEKETWLDTLMSCCLPCDSGFFVDVGVNIGQTLIKYVKLKADNGYIGFDPNPDAIAFAERIIWLNRIQNAYLVSSGLAQSCGVGRLWIKTNYGSAATILEDFRSEEFHDRVKCVSLLNGDKVFEDLAIDSISMVKIDVEGSELDVLLGLRDTLAKTRPFIVVEILPIYDISVARNIIRKTKSDQIVSLMKAMNYRMYRILSGPSVRLSRVDDIEIHSDLNLCNYFCAPDALDKDMRQRLACNGVLIRE